MRCSVIEARVMQAPPVEHPLRRIVQAVVACLLVGLASCGSDDASSTATTLAQEDKTLQITTSSVPTPTPTAGQPASPETDPAPKTDAPTTSVSEPILPAATFPQRVPPITVTCTGAYVANDTLPLAPCQKGSVVADVQKALAGFGYDITADGLYGQATADAVQSFQYVMGLPETGVVDEATWTALGIDSEVDF